MNSEQAANARDRKVEWLIKHKDLWVGWLSWERYDKRRRQLFEAMKAEGLYAPTTNWKDTNTYLLLELAQKREHWPKNTQLVYFTTKDKQERLGVYDEMRERFWIYGTAEEMLHRGNRHVTPVGAQVFAQWAVTKWRPYNDEVDEN